MLAVITPPWPGFEDGRSHRLNLPLFLRAVPLRLPPADGKASAGASAPGPDIIQVLRDSHHP
jgi:hypothetical protein